MTNSTRRALSTLADMFAGSYYASCTSDFAAGPWTYGALSMIASRSITAPAVAAIEKAAPGWRDWSREEAITELRALAGAPEVENAALEAAHKELEDTRQALGQALGIHPASQYSLAEMVTEATHRLTAKTSAA